MKPSEFDNLRQHYFFNALSEEQFERIRSVSLSISLDEGKHLFEAGDTADLFYLLESGLIQLYRLSPGGEEKVIELIYPGQLFAEAVMFFKPCIYPVSAKAVIPCRLWSIDLNKFVTLLSESNDLCLSMMGEMSKRLHRAIQDIEQLTLQNACVRVIHLLLQSAPEKQANSYQVEWQTPKHILASRMSIRPETLSRILQDLNRRDLIEVKGKSIEILDCEGLQRLISVETSKSRA